MNNIQTGLPYSPGEERKTKHKQIDYQEGCTQSATKAVVQCNEILVGPGSSSGISVTQLAAGVAEAELLTITHDKRPVWRENLLDYHLSSIQQGKDVGPIDYPGSHASLQRAIEAIKVIETNPVQYLVVLVPG